MPGTEILSVAHMYAADRRAVESGVSSVELMEAAGAGVAHEIALRWSVGNIAVLCGPGNNGGDGFVAARYLQEVGWTVRLALLGERHDLGGDAAHMAKLWLGEVESLGPEILEHADVVVDALFGAGLARPVDGRAADVLKAVAQSGLPVVAVDLPSGVDGDSGQVLGMAAPANLSVTFHKAKTGHFLLPGRALCGELVVVDIGIPEPEPAPEPDLDPDPAVVHENDPALWLSALPRVGRGDHKYLRGHAVIVSGAALSSGAARLAARAALRIGAGLVTAVGPHDAMLLHAATTAAVLTEDCETTAEFDHLLGQRRRNAVLLGPGNGVTEATRANVLAALARNMSCVLDADALTVFADRAAELCAAISGNCVLTPHDGEFARLFGAAEPGTSKLSRTRHAALRSGAVVVSKGGDTVVAAPDGRAVINTNAPPTLATAGSGDVLAGLIVGLLAQGASPFDAACAAVWMHGEAGHEAGLGLIADDLPEALIPVLQRLF